MTLVFDAMGLIPALIGANADKLGYQPGAFLDMSKLFAGVLVGGAAGATAATTARVEGKVHNVPVGVSTKSRGMVTAVNLRRGPTMTTPHEFV